MQGVSSHQGQAPLTIFWFRRDLRLGDNHGLSLALRNHQRVLPIFIFDPYILDKLEDKADRRVTFIHETLAKMRERLRAWGSSLWVFYGRPGKVIERLLEDHPVEAFYTNRDYEPYARTRDDEVAELLARRNIPFHRLKDQVIFEEHDVVKGDGLPYTVFSPYKKRWLARLCETDLAPHPVGEYRNLLMPADGETSWVSLSDLGFTHGNPDFPPTEIREHKLRHYHEFRDFPAEDTPSRLGLHLRFGTISIRDTMARARTINETWMSELIWREFFMSILFHFPHVVDQPFRAKYATIPWRNRQDEFERWCAGQTGIPIVDAGMRELNVTGSMHNRVRMITASFLCKHLLIDWRWGERYFAKKLLDYDLSANNGNWQWSAGTGCDAAPYFRVFNPWTQAKKFDPEAIYISRWVPEWNKPHYPAPMVDHAFARKRALLVYKTALDGEVAPTGTQSELFD